MLVVYSKLEIALQAKRSLWPSLSPLSLIWLMLKKTSSSCQQLPILGDPGAVNRVDKMSVVKVYCKMGTYSFELPASDWPEKKFSGQSAKRSSRVTLIFS